MSVETGIGKWLGPIATWFGTQAGVEFSITLLLALVYWVLVVLIRWHLIARPVLRNLEARISKVRADVPVPAAPAPPQAGETNTLLDQARAAIRKLNVLDFLFWNRGQEAAGWQLVHEAERRRVVLMAPDEVRVRLETALEELRASGSDALKALAGKLEALSQKTAPAVDAKVLLDEALRVLYKARDEKFFVLINWNNKLNWLGLCSVVLIVTLAGTVTRSVLFLAGATGGLISRLTRQVKTQEIPRDYGSGWTTLFLSPLFGALAGWTGVLMVHVLSADSQYLGKTFQNLWENPYGPEALAVALLMGLTERAFDRMVGTLETRLAPPGGGEDGGRVKESPRLTTPQPGIQQPEAKKPAVTGEATAERRPETQQPEGEKPEQTGEAKAEPQQEAQQMEAEKPEQTGEAKTEPQPEAQQPEAEEPEQTGEAKAAPQPEAQQPEAEEPEQTGEAKAAPQPKAQ